MLSGSPWQNPALCEDVNDDGAISPADALVAINGPLNAGQSGPLTGQASAPGVDDSGSDFLDASGDGRLSPLDALMVINAINSGRRSDDAGEDHPATDQQPDQIAADVPARSPHRRLCPGASRARYGRRHRRVSRDAGHQPARRDGVFTSRRAQRVDRRDAAGDVLGTAASVTDHSHHHAASVTAAVTAGDSYFVVVSMRQRVTGRYTLQVIDGDATGLQHAPRRHGPGHDVNDNHGVHAGDDNDDDANHDVGDDHGVDMTDDDDDD